MKVLFFALLVLSTALVPAYAQDDTWFSVNVPFAFYVGDQAMPEGNYQLVQSSQLPYLFRVNAINNSKVEPIALAVGNVEHNVSAADLITRLVFAKYDDQHIFLRKFSRLGDRSVVLPMGKKERERITTRFISARTPEVVVVAAKGL